jgi:uncharacterized protein YjbJ (UPF0337 family)
VKEMAGQVTGGANRKAKGKAAKVKLGNKKGALTNTLSA